MPQSNDSYPLPDYAATIWSEGHQLVLCLPPIAGQTRAHTVKIPANASGMLILSHVLRARAERPSAATVGTSAAPVQYDIDAMLAAVGKVIPAQRKRDAKEFLTIEDLDL